MKVMNNLNTYKGDNKKGYMSREEEINEQIMKIIVGKT